MSRPQRKTSGMIRRFCLYSVLKNLRFADPFLLLYLRHLGLSYTALGALLGFQHLIKALLEVPLGVFADRFGRRRSLAAGFACYAASFTAYPLAESFSGRPQGALLYVAAATFGLGEALRSGSHAAIILDYLHGRGESERATQVAGLARSFSKWSAGGSALIAGLLLSTVSSWPLLFWLSAGAAVSGFGLMLSYPSALEGEQTRDRVEGRAAPFDVVGKLRALTARPGALVLFGQSVLFEGQVKLMLKYHVQLFLNEGLRSLGLPVVTGVPAAAVAPAAAGARSGAFWMGLNEGLRGAVGGLGARLADRLQRRLGGTLRSLDLAYLLAFVASVGLAACAAWLGGLFFLGLALFLILTLLHDARRPVFVAAFDRVMDGPQRATALSIHAQASSLTFAVTLPVTGWIADHLGLGAVFAVIAAILAPGLLLRARRTPLPPQ